MTQIPRIDPSVVHLTLGAFRRLGAGDLPAKTYVINDGGEQPLAVCVPYATFLEMQRAIETVPQTLPAEREALEAHWREKAGDMS